MKLIIILEVFEDKGLYGYKVQMENNIVIEVSHTGGE